MEKGRVAENDPIRVVKTVPALVFGILLVGASVLAVSIWKVNVDPTDSFGEFQISGGSMADALVGEHFAVRCGDCGFSFQCDATNPPHDELAVCPNCGYAKNHLTKEILKAGDVVSVSPFSDADPPKRWEIVTFQSPDDDSQLSVKRIVGLPGEKVELRGGDVFIDGKVERKSLAQLREMAIAIHDSAFQPKLDDTSPRRWVGEGANSGWRETTGGFEFEKSHTHTSSHDWLLYHHWHCMPSNQPRTKQAAIKDHYGYNQGLARNLSSVRDIILECRLSLDEWDTFTMLITSREGTFQAEMSRETNLATLRHDGESIGSAELPHSVSADEAMLEFAVIDQQAILAVDRNPLIRVDIASDRELRPIPLNPLRIGASGGRIIVRRIRILRDIHYSRPKGVSWALPTEWQLGKDEYFVVGDNIPISRDSRMWKMPAVQRKMFLGRVLKREN